MIRTLIKEDAFCQAAFFGCIFRFSNCSCSNGSVPVASFSLTIKAVPLIVLPYRGICYLKKANIRSDISELFIVILHPVNMRR